MGTNVVNVGRAPTYGSGWSTAGQAIDSGLQSVLGYYQQYQQQKRFEANQAQEAKWKAMEMADRADQHKFMQEDRQDRRNQVQASEWEKNAPMMTEAQAMELPDYTQTVLAPTQPTPEQMGAVPDTGEAAAPLAPPTEKKELLRSKKFGNYTGYADFGGKQAAAAKRAEKQADWLPLAEDFMGMSAGTVVPPTVWTLAGKQEKPTFQHGADGAIYRETPDGLKLEIRGKAPAVSPADRKALQDESTNAMLDSIVPDDPSTIPPQYRDLVVAFTEGRGIRPRAGTNVNLLQQMAWKYKPTLDMQVVEARGGLRKDLVKGAQTARGGQITSLNTLGSHLKSLQEAADKLAKSSLGNSGFSRGNWLAQKLTPSSTHGVLATYGEKANAVREEYIRALKGASPTETEIKAFEAIADTTISPTERQARIDALMELAEGRANAQEAVWSGAFGKRSTESGSPMFSGEWTDADGTWRLRKPGAGAGATSNPFGMKKPGRQ